MKIHPILTNHNIKNNNTKKYNSINFGTYNPARAKVFEEKLAKKGILANTHGNDFVAECFDKITDIFKPLFGSSSLPSYVDFESLGGSYGVYYNGSNKVVMNSDFEYGCFYDMDNLKKEMQSYKKRFLPQWFSTLHPAHTFVHEFAHSAHWHNLENRNGYNSAYRVWKGLEGTTVPTAIGRLITRFKLSNYAVEPRDMCEFMAERMSKDICGGLTDNMWIKYKDIDVDYSNIFNRKWNYRYSTPQSYIDYFTQQVWNGDIDEANRTGDKVEQYLAELDAERVAPAVQGIAAITACNPILGMIGNIFSNVSEKITDHLDDRNKLTLQ